MDLKHIRDVRCPQCQAEIISESRQSQHTTGEWNEYRVFACGLRLHYSPNMGRVELESRYGYVPEDQRFSSMCRKDPRLTEHKQHAKQALVTVRAALEGLDIPADLAEKLKRTVSEYERYKVYA